MNKPLVKKENLEKLLKLLQQLIHVKGNEWFRDALKKMVSGDNQQVVSSEGINHTYSENSGNYIVINPNALLIDYDRITDEKVRTQLKSDCFEMARHRLGRANHKPDFEEFCRFANLQAEELINYYLLKKHAHNLDQITSFISQYNPKYQPRTPPKSVGQIEYAFKLFALGQIFKFDTPVLYFLKDIRNETSHRSTYSLRNEDEILDKYNRGIYLDEIQKREVKFIITKRETDFDRIYLALTQLGEQLISKL